MASDLDSQSGYEFVTGKPAKKRFRLNYDKHILLLTFLISVPPAAVAELLLWLGDHSSELKWTVTLFIALAWLIGSSVLHAAVIRPLQTLSNMVAAIREEDFSFRVRGGSTRLAGVPGGRSADLTDDIPGQAWPLGYQSHCLP